MSRGCSPKGIEILQEMTRRECYGYRQVF